MSMIGIWWKMKGRWEGREVEGGMEGREGRGEKEGGEKEGGEKEGGEGGE